MHALITAGKKQKMASLSLSSIRLMSFNNFAKHLFPKSSFRSYKTSVNKRPWYFSCQKCICAGLVTAQSSTSTNIRFAAFVSPFLSPKRTQWTSSSFTFRDYSSSSANRNYQYARKSNAKTDMVLYVISGVIFMIGVSYASVPLYRIFCQATGIGGDPKLGHKVENVATMTAVRERPITVVFNADKHAAMQWNFKPSQTRVKVVPGETALAFYTAKNPTNEPIVGVATYNVLPFQAGIYFNKIQCFCFEEQWLNPHEEVDMPVFFYIDPEFDNDPLLAAIDEIVLSYTFFKAEEGQILPVPGFMNNRFKGAQAAS